MKKQKIRFLLGDLLVFLFVLYCFYSYGLQPFFTWKTFCGGIFGHMGSIPFRSIIGLMIALTGLVYLCPMKVERQMLILSLWVFAEAVFIIFAGGFHHIFSFEWLLYSSVICFLLVSKELKIKTYRLFYNLFVISLIIPIIIYVLLQFGIPVPYMELQSPESIKEYYGIYYKIYPFASQWDHMNSSSYYGLRMCGIYNEPGVIGTFSALLLGIEKYKMKGDWKNKILFLAGILSFSLAFYALTVIFFLCQFISLKKKNIIIVFILLFVYFAAITIPFSNPNIVKIQHRLMITENGLNGDNRTNSQYDAVFNEFFESDFLTLVFGKGESAIEDILEERNIDGCSYKNLIYDYGYLGFVSQILWICVFGKFVGRKKGREPCIYLVTCSLMFFANLYQRPSMFALQYIMIFVGGIYKQIESEVKCDSTV